MWCELAITPRGKKKGKKKEENKCNAEKQGWWISDTPNYKLKSQWSVTDY